MEWDVNSFAQGPSNHSYTNSFVHWWIEKMPLGRKSTNSCIPRMTIFLDGRVRFPNLLLLAKSTSVFISLSCLLHFRSFDWLLIFTPSLLLHLVRPYPPDCPLLQGLSWAEIPLLVSFGHSWIVEQIPPADTGRTTTIRPLTNTKVVSLCLARAFCRLLTILIYSICKHLVHYKGEPSLKVSFSRQVSAYTAFLLVDIQVWIHFYELTWLEKYTFKLDSSLVAGHGLGSFSYLKASLDVSV